jgi:hypothetical protein
VPSTSIKAPSDLFREERPNLQIPWNMAHSRGIPQCRVQRLQAWRSAGGRTCARLHALHSSHRPLPSLFDSHTPSTNSPASIYSWPPLPPLSHTAKLSPRWAARSKGKFREFEDGGLHYAVTPIDPVVVQVLNQSSPLHLGLWRARGRP